MVEVVNRHHLPAGWERSPEFADHVYIGRGSEFGNPFQIGRDGDRERVVELYREWFLERVKEPAFRRRVWELEGKKLVCFCCPKACHGDVLKWWLENE